MKSAIFQILLPFCLLLFSVSDSEALALKTEHFQLKTRANGDLLTCTEDYFYTSGNGNNGANSNQLISFGNWGGATTHTFTYDANGSRLTMSANGSTKSVVTASVVGVVGKVLESGSNIGNVKGIFDGIHHSGEKVGNVAFNARHSGDSLTWSWLKGTATALGEVTGANGIVEAGLERELGTQRPLSDEERVGRFFGGISQMVSLAAPSARRISLKSIPTTKIGRWMSPKELAKMKKSGRVQEGAGGLTFASTDEPSSFKAQAKPGSVYVEYEVPSNSLLKGGKKGWVKNIGPRASKSQKHLLKNKVVNNYPKSKT